MDTLSDADVLALWERATTAAPGASHTLALASAALDVAPPEVAAATLGEVNAALLRLWRAVGTGSGDAVVTCPTCRTDTGFVIDVDALVGDAERTTPPAAVTESGWHVAWRPLTLGDVADAAAAGAVEAAETILLAAAVEIAKAPDGQPVDVAALPASVRAAVAAAIEAVDPLAEVQARLDCPGCTETFTADLDPAVFAWAAVQTRAWRLFSDVDALARAYGWTEADVLALSPQRRDVYLRLLDGELT